MPRQTPQPPVRQSSLRDNQGYRPVSDQRGYQATGGTTSGPQGPPPQAGTGAAQSTGAPAAQTNTSSGTGSSSSSQ
jgi:hypothetical protein